MRALSFPVSSYLRYCWLGLIVTSVSIVLCLATNFSRATSMKAIAETFGLFMWQQHLPTKNTLCATETAVSLFTNIVYFIKSVQTHKDTYSLLI